VLTAAAAPVKLRLAESQTGDKHRRFLLDAHMSVASRCACFSSYYRNPFIEGGQKIPSAGMHVNTTARGLDSSLGPLQS
jgi:hypothetical protein